VNPILLVARREIRERVKARSFRIATAISAVVVIAAIAIPASQKSHTATYDIGVVDPPSAEPTTQIQGLAPSLGVRIHVVAVPSRDAAAAQLRQGRIDVAVIDSDEVLTKRALDEGDTSKKAQLVAALSNVVRLQRFVAQAGPGAAAALAALQAPVAANGVEPRDATASQRFTAFLGILLLFVFLQQYGTWVLMGVIEEKASRVVEVLLSALRPRQLVSGKVLGIGAVAMAQALVVAAAAFVTATITGAHVFQGATRFTVLWTIVWFLLGYGFYAWAFAAVGSLVSRQADAQNAAFPLTVPLLIGYLSATTLLGATEPSPFIRVLAFLPPTSPMVMPMLIGLGKAPGWQIATSIVVSVTGIALLMRLAGDIYSRAILHSGQRLKLGQVLRGDFSAA
jgi:ABC-2 type transport system permease protein